MNAEARQCTLFALGRVVATPGALTLLDKAGVSGLEHLLRHATGDFGSLVAEDKAANTTAIEEGTRILSAYEIAGERLWIITEADRSVTTLLLPEEY